MLGQKRGTSSSAATTSRASSRASGTRASSRIAVSSATTSPTVAAPGGGAEAAYGPSGRQRAERSASGSLTEPLLDVGHPERLDQRPDVAAEHAVDVVESEPDAVVGDAALREVVGADLRRAVARADLRLAHARALRFLLGDPRVEQSRAQHLHRLELVLELRLLVLLADDDAARDVRDAHRGVGRVDALPARPRGAEDVDPEVLVLDPDVDLLGLRQYGDRGGRGVDAALGLGGGHALDAVHAGLPAHGAEGAGAVHLEDRLLDPAERAVGVRDDLEAPPLPGDEALVHPV